MQEAKQREIMSSRTSRRSLAYVNFRRAISYGKIYLIMAIVISILLSVIYLSIPTAATTTSVPGNVIPVALTNLSALILPLFAEIGSFGGLMIFVSDKDKGVYEYLIAYGVDPSRIFWAVVQASVGLVSVVLAASISANIIIAFVAGALSFTYAEILIFYVIPISYGASIFMAMAGMVWSSLAVRRSGINSPVGIVSILGMIPVMVVLVISFLLSSTELLILVSTVSLALFALVGVMIRVSNSRMVRERFLSSA